MTKKETIDQDAASLSTAVIQLNLAEAVISQQRLKLQELRREIIHLQRECIGRSNHAYLAKKVCPNLRHQIKSYIKK